MLQANLSQAFIMYLCSICTGINTGFPGASTLANSTLVSLVGAQARRFSGLLLPVLLAADGYAVYAYRRTVRWDVVRDMILPIAVGMFSGFLLLGRFDVHWVRKLVGMTVLVMGSISFAIHVRDDMAGRKVDDDSDAQLPTKVTPLKADMGVGAAGGNRSILQVIKSFTSTGLFRAILAYTCGFLSIIANGSALILILYLLNLNLAPRALNGTRANIFLIINLSKIPGQILLGNLHLSFDDAYIVIPLCMAAIISAYAAESLVLPCISQSRFDRLSWLLVFMGAMAMTTL